VQATEGVTRITEGVHQSVLGTMGIPAGNSPEQTRCITGLVYRNVLNITQLVGKSQSSVPVTEILEELPPKQFKSYTVRQAAKGPLELKAVRLQVWLNRGQMPSRPAWLLITQSLGEEPEIKYFLAEARWTTGVAELLRVAFSRWTIEQCFEQAKQEVGMSQYETRSWAGWNHHMTMVMLAHHFLAIQRLKRGKKGARADRRGGRPHPASADRAPRRPAAAAV